MNDFNAKTILLEREYIDKDYLEDYSRYYVKCFNNYGHKCARLHFFTTEVTHCDLEKILRGESDDTAIDNLRNGYLGFVVVKPLPKTFIGKTCLKLYDRMKDAAAARSCLSREYKVDLFGIPLKVESVAFQEQDKVVAACATTAIWSALHALTCRSQRDVPACSEITTNAINHISESSNRFPNKELTNKQMLRALDMEKLRYHASEISKTSRESFLRTVKCFIDSKTPLILGVDVYSVTGSNILSKQAGHAATILGYKAASHDPTIYIHDDRFGPFVRGMFVALDDYKLPNGDEFQSGAWGLSLHEKNDCKEWEQSPREILIPSSLIIPTDRKVRLSEDLVSMTCKKIVVSHDNLVKKIAEDLFAKRQITSVSEHIREHIGAKFETRLEEISSIRQEILKIRFQDADGEKVSELNKRRSYFLSGSYARFQWVARFTYKDIPAFRIFFDATDIPQGDVVSGVFYENIDCTEFILSRVRQYAEKLTPEEAGNSLFGAIIKSLTPPELGYFDHLDEKFGQVRAPKYLKDGEIEVSSAVGRNSTLKTYYSPQRDIHLNDIHGDIVDGDENSYALWAVSHDGALLLGKEVGSQGHPTLTGFKPARIAGELRKIDGKWTINSKSGRYSGDYTNINELLENALYLFRSIFNESSESIQFQPFSQ